MSKRRDVTFDEWEAGRLVDVPRTAMFGYYRATIVPGYARAGGFESHEEAHEHLKAGFFWLTPGDPRIPSMASMSFEECDRYLHWIMRKCAEGGIPIEEPRPRRKACA
jgi:hypothetical protein